ncbi:ABC transporter substrate-binding protein [Dysosmobacter welbionis]|uniref:ABC transporter substrate-binding protein n=1 Tax=Dysosmobacter welbionis TaxID=2093857 RepID=UPI002356ED18|nr:ABC transporter substrate-binding protein [Dysosmobacter welbionis]
MKKRVFALFTAMFLLCGMLAGCGPTGSSSTTTDGSDDGAKDTLIVAIPESPTYMDPMVQASIGTYRVTTQMFDRLVMMDNDMNLVPGLAESWEVIDDTTTVFHLRQGVKFHNGEEMTSEDVKYSLERCIANPGVNYNYLIIESITCDDDYTVTIKTSAPFNALLYRLSLDAASIICKSADTSAEEFNKNPVGTGPFKFVSWELGGDVVLEAFEDYWGGAPAVKRVIFRTIPEALNRTIGLETGEVDLAYDLGITDLESLAGNESVTTLTSPSTTVWYVGMNVQKAPFDNEKVRQAVAYALDPQGYIDLVFSGEATPANYTMLPPSVDGYVSDCSDYSCNVEKAKELLAEAGYPDGFSTTLWCSDTQVMRDSAVVIQEQLRQVGINAEVKTLESGQFQSETGNGAHDMFIMSKTSIDPDSMLRSMYHTEALGPSGNRCFWTTPEVDALIDEASTTTDTEHAMELYAEIQGKVAEAAPLVPMAVEHLNAGMQSNVKGFGLYPGKSHYITRTHFHAAHSGIPVSGRRQKPPSACANLRYGKGE